ncbi:uncharacterized protein LOC142163431 [Nicotiana tabacum]|uniref:Uncharacterized protein LOC142163431 n=1 Tax=Nicotiana tabacum TaxID=4097 RepID=A0AC58RVR1_TOBAC
MGDKVQWPKEIRSNPNRRNPNFWCEFHNDHGHKKTDCRLLQGEVEYLLKQGYLPELFSEKGKQAYMKNMQEPPKPSSLKRTVNVISGGEGINGVTYTTTKKVSKITVIHGKRVRQVLEEDNITFDDADVDGVLIPHNDALVYIDDMLVKSQQTGDHIQHLTNTFHILRKFNMKLNPEKCAFGVSLALKKQNQFEWFEECKQALKNLKAYLSNPPLLAKPKDGEKLLVYLAVSEVAVSAVLVREDQGTWTLFTDGSSNVKGAGLVIVMVPPTGETIRQEIKCHPITNNEVEYEAVIAGLELARELEIEQVVIKSDSQLVVNQMQRTYTAREVRMQQYLEKARDLVSPLARCLGPSQTEYVMREIHEGHCGNHAGGRSLVKTMIRASYYWPKMEEDAEFFLAKCDKCQRYGNNMHRPAELLHIVVAPWPFMKRGMDIVGPLLQAKGKVHKSLFFQSWQIKRITSRPYHPVGNEQVESINKVIINNLKKRMEESKGNWPEVLPGVLWAYRTTTKTSTGEIPFSLVYEAEALIPVEIGEPSTRYAQASEESNEEEMQINLDLLEERRETALIRMTAQKQVMKRYYNQKAHLRYIKIGDYVLKKVFQSTRAANAGKLSQTWEGPYKIYDIVGKGAYELETLDDKILPSNWNAVHLKRYYF